MTASDRSDRTAAADALCVAAFEKAGAPVVGVSLVAVGGYGRGELAPASDLDVVLVHEEGVDPGRAAEEVWYPLWDSGSRLDHSVRSLPEMVEAARGDLKVALGLLDVRHLTGDASLTLQLRSTMLTEWRRDARGRLPALRELVRARHELLGELAHLSVPDVKEAAGGLRDATVLKALVASWLVDVPHVELEQSRRTLLDVRDVLHDVAGRATDRIAPEVWPELAAVLREGSVVGEAGRHVVWAAGERRTRRATPYAARTTVRGEPVVLVPGFLAGDASLSLMARSLRHRGYRTYRSLIGVNVGCTMTAAAELEARIEAVVARRGDRVQVVGHSLGGMLARGLAVRRPDLVAGIVTMGSPMLAPAAHHASLSRSVDVLVRLSRAGLPGLMAEDCVAGACARESFEESRQPLPEGVAFTAIYSRRDGIVDWRACVDPLATEVEVTASHLGMAVDPVTIEQVTAALARHRRRSSVVEVDRGESA